MIKKKSRKSSWLSKHENNREMMDMIIHVLMDNQSSGEDFKNEHGLSLFIEAQERILFDTGASRDFAENASALGVDLGSCDLAVLSHGHYDHGGGLEAFFEVNDRAPVYVQSSAFHEFFEKEHGEWKYIGLPESLKGSPRFTLKEGNYPLDDHAEVFSDVEPRRLNPPNNSAMYRKEPGGMQNDDFSHEQNLILEEKGRLLLITGCAHKGIVNILEDFHRIRGRFPDVVIGGFHLLDDDRGITEEFLMEVGEYLDRTGSVFHTGHCTGGKAFRTLKEILGEKMRGISAGTSLRLFKDADR